MAIILGGVLEETRPVRSVIPQTDISSIDGQKSWAGLTRVNWINAFLPTMRRPFTGNNMKICRIKSVWRARRDQVLGGHGVLSNKGLWGFEDIEEGQCYIHILSLKAYSCRDILWTVYQIQSEWWCSPPAPLIGFFKIVSVDSLVAIYSHNLVAIINCDYPSRTREPLLPGCLGSRLIESQVSINYQGVLADCICSVLGHHALPSYPRPTWPSSRADWSGGE